jgi:hypothetical protein
MMLLRIDRWKLFLFFMMPALVGGTLMLAGKFVFGDNRAVLLIGQIITLIAIAAFVYWGYSIGINLARLAPNQNHNLLLFKFALAFAFIYRVSVDLYSVYASMDVESVLWIIPIGLTATIAALYCFYTDAKLLVSAERQQLSEFKDVWKTFVLIAIFPIGVWSIQPRLQTLLGSK